MMKKLCEDAQKWHPQKSQTSKYEAQRKELMEERKTMTTTRKKKRKQQKRKMTKKRT